MTRLHLAVFACGLIVGLALWYFLLKDRIARWLQRRWER